ncbi:MAG TPA: glycine dehydrogenase, partial [Candidatus Methylomirabilis sp.]|nr:glycine dehydrogenase [Candidatus Methylomirabilis sp.]
LKEVALQNLRKAAYAKERLAKLKGCGVRFSGPTFNEFVLQVKKRPADILKGLLKKQIIGGLDLGGFYPELKDCLLVCVTEQNSREEIDALAKAMGGGR